jgi:branched-chain amino acid transport system substrate-binding protein
MPKQQFLAWVAALGLAAASVVPAVAQNAPGVMAHEIKIGQTMPYSGPASAYGTIGRAESAYFKMVNEEGGVHGRKIDLISLDDGYNPARTVQDVRKLVEEDHVAFLFNTLGTPSNMAIQKYLNQKKIPQLFVATGADHWGDYKQFPWTMGWQPSYQVEARIYAHYILEHKPDAKIAVLYQDDDFGQDYLTGLKEGLGAKAAKMIVSTQSYVTTDPTVDSQIVSLQGSGANTLLVAATPKFAAQAIHKVASLGWHPLFFMTNVSVSLYVLKPAGLKNSTGLITAAYLKDPTDPEWDKDPGMAAYKAFMAKYYPGGQAGDVNNAYGYSLAETMVQLLKQCGNNLSRANVMKQAAHLHMSLPLLLPGIKLKTSPTDYRPITDMQLARFSGLTWVLFGKVISGAGM